MVFFTSRRPQLRPLKDAGELLRLGHRAPNSHDKRRGHVDLLLRPRFGRVEIAPAIGLADDIPDASIQRGVAVMLEAAGA